MKRYCSVLLLLGLFAFAAIAQDAASTVYVTRTGKAYHNDGCSSLRKSSIPMKLSEAAERYSPCGRCKPPVLSTSRSEASAPATLTPGNSSPTPKPNDEAVGQTSKGQTIYEGPRGGRYHYSKSGKKVYERKRK